MKGRRWSDGLHQAVEAKEGVKIEKENQTLATITLQNYFRLYEKLSGMTGTAETEAAEFGTTYKLDVIVIPTHMPMVRRDFSDVIYRTLPEKWDAVIEEIKDCHDRGQPALVGTVSVENSELIARRLQRDAVPHNVLNAKYHEREAEIIAQAGRKGAVTIATNMAGRGTDILLAAIPISWRASFSRKRRSIRTRLLKNSGHRLSRGRNKLSKMSTRKWSALAACIFWAPNATNRGASTISCADVPAARAILARHVFSFRSKMI